MNFKKRRREIRDSEKERGEKKSEKKLLKTTDRPTEQQNARSMPNIWYGAQLFSAAAFKI